MDRPGNAITDGNVQTYVSSVETGESKVERGECYFVFVRYCVFMRKANYVFRNLLNICIDKL